MTHIEFLTLSDTERYNVVIERGVRVAERIDGAYNYVLYQIASFYLEGKIDTSDGSVQSITSFSSTAPLEKYISQGD